MLPTIDSQLEAIRRSLDLIADRESLSEDLKGELVALSRATRLVERSWAGRLPYLVGDNAALTDLLRGLADLTSPELGGEIAATLGGLVDTPLDLPAVEQGNATLRDLLARVVVAAGRDADADRADLVARRTLAGLKASLGARPW